MMTADTPSASITHDVARQRFEIHHDPETAFLSYTRRGEVLILTHTYVPEGLRGRGMAGAMVRAALDEARRQHWKIIPQCSYVAAFVKRHPEFVDLCTSAYVMNQKTIQARKQSLREWCKHSLHALQDVETLSRTICGRLMEMPEYRAARTVCTFLSLSNEVQPARPSSRSLARSAFGPEA